MTRQLVIVPTSFEMLRVRPNLVLSCSEIDLVFGHCGFGPIASAARTSQLLAHHNPDRVILVGIAGAIDSDLSIGEAFGFLEVVCYGVGAGTGSEFVSASKMGWHQWHSDDSSSNEGELPNPEPIGDMIGLNFDSIPMKSRRFQLLTSPSASASPRDVTFKQEQYSEASAEDMEGFSVALACRLAGVELTIVRGISNRAGDRDKSGWKIEEALDAAASLTSEVIHGS